MTIKDISAQTGYSVGTVSRVLNNQPNVSEKARKAILEAARATGFQLNTNAKQLKQQHSNSILVLVKGTSNQLFGALVEQLQLRMRDTSYPLTVDYLDENRNEVRRALQLCLEKKPRGILFMGGNRRHFEQDFQRIDVPCVLVTNDGSGLPFENLSSVCSSDDQAVRELMEGLIQMGHRRIAVIGGDRQISDTTRRRLQGCMAAFQAHGIEFDPELDYVGVRFSSADGYKAAEMLLSRGRNHTAIFCMADVMAMGAIRALSDHGLRVPEDVSVVGFDGLPIGDYTVPRLATVSQSVKILAQRSVELLTQSIEGTAAPVHEVVPAQPLWRESAREI
jgi:LacI family transcriptional regulator